MTILSRNRILEMQSGPSDKRLIRSNFKLDSVRTGSYDLCLGSEYSLSTKESLQASDSAEPIFRSLYSSAPLLEIPANGVAMVESEEIVSLQRNMVGHATLKMDVLLKGVVIASQSQIDAGFFGRIFCLLHNLSATTVVLRFRDPFLRLEFALLDEPVPFDDTYQGDYQDKLRLSEVLDHRITSSLEEMQHTATDVHERVDRLYRREVIGLLGVLASILLIVAAFSIPIYFGLFGVWSNPQNQINTLQHQLQIQERELQTLQKGSEKGDRRSNPPLRPRASLASTSQQPGTVKS